MKKIIIVAFFILFPATGFAAFVGAMTPLHFFGSSFIELEVASPPADTCSYYGYHFRFDATTPEGKNKLAILMMAKATNKKIQIWYTPSSAPGANQTNGCLEGAMAVINFIGIN